MVDPREMHGEEHGHEEGKKQDAPGEENKMGQRPDYGYKSYKGSGKLKGKVALITGADSGIGRAVALAYAREGADVAVAYLNEHEDAEETKQVVEEAGRRCILLPGDLAEEEHIKQIVDKTIDEFDHLDILVNNASMQGDAVDDFTKIGRERMTKTFLVNIVGMISLAQHAVPHMKPGSCIINVASVLAYTPMPEILDYACTKGAIVTMTKALAQQLISKKGIRVNGVAPGPIWTPIPVESFSEDMVKDFGKGMTPIDRPGQPAEVAPTFVFLASNADSSYVNGTIIGVTGGMPIN